MFNRIDTLIYSSIFALFGAIMWLAAVIGYVIFNEITTFSLVTFGLGCIIQLIHTVVDLMVLLGPRSKK